MIQAGISIMGAQVNVLGITFKEDGPMRNSKVADLVESHVPMAWKWPCTTFAADAAKHR